VALGRRGLRLQKHRRGAFGLLRRLEDHFVPVISKAHSCFIRRVVTPPEALDQLSLAPDVSFLPSIIGRDLDILKLERTLAYTNVVHVYGPGGSCKSYLAHFLVEWWVTTGFFDGVPIVSCRDLSLEGVDTLQQQFAALIRTSPVSSSFGSTTTSGTANNSNRGRYLVFVDGSETIDYIKGLEKYSLPVLGETERTVSRSFLHSYCQQEDVLWKLVVLSRTDTLAGAHLGACAPADKKPGYYELKNPRSSHAVQIAGAGLCARETTTLSIQGLAKELQMHLPSIMAANLAPALEVPKPGQLDLIANFARVVRALQKDYPLVHRMLVTWAPFRQRSLNSRTMAPESVNSRPQHSRRLRRVDAVESSHLP
jgi:hypothetical protein